MNGDGSMLVVNGIMTNPLSVRGWTDRWCAAVNSNNDIPWRADRYEYWSGPVSTMFRRGYHAAELAEVVRRYDCAPRICVVGHSDAANVIRIMLQRENALPHIDDVVLIAPACDPNISSNGYGDALTTGKVGCLWVYCSHDDLVLRAVYNRAWRRWLGYGAMGYTGPRSIPLPLVPRVRTRQFYGVGHCEYFDRDNMETTFNSVLASVNPIRREQ